MKKLWWSDWTLITNKPARSWITTARKGSTQPWMLSSHPTLSLLPFRQPSQGKEKINYDYLDRDSYSTRRSYFTLKRHLLFSSSKPSRHKLFFHTHTLIHLWNGMNDEIYILVSHAWLSFVGKLLEIVNWIHFTLHHRALQHIISKLEKELSCYRRSWIKVAIYVYVISFSKNKFIFNPEHCVDYVSLFTIITEIKCVSVNNLHSVQWWRQIIYFQCIIWSMGWNLTTWYWISLVFKDPLYQ